MNKKEQHNDHEVYFLGAQKEEPVTSRRKIKIWIAVGCGALVLLLVIATLFFLTREPQVDQYFEPEIELPPVVVMPIENVDTVRSFVERLEETVNDVPMYVYIPHNAELSLGLAAEIEDKDLAIICVMQAADIRSDNKKIVGDFVLKGNRLSRGVAKKGFCAVIDNKITIGTAEETSLLRQAIDSSGYFFRQYPLVFHGEVMENRLKNKSIRRAIGVRSGRVVMVESRSNESLHDFSHALIDIGVTDAITLVGSSTAYGWYMDEEGTKNEYGNLPDPELENTSYIIWRRP